MTALKKFERLESTGLWKATPDAQRREVIISFGKATLALTNRNDMAVTHWSLAAIHRLNPGERPALFAPDSGGSETLEISDDTMVAAVEEIRKALDRQASHPGRLRKYGMRAFLFSVAALLIFWLPGAVIRHTATVVPDVTERAIGAALRDRLTRLTGKACDAETGLAALDRLQNQVAPDRSQLIVVRDGVDSIVRLPGQIVVANRTLVEDHEQPEVLAGYLIADDILGRDHSALLDLLNESGVIASIRLLTSGKMPESALDHYAEVLLTQPRSMPDQDALLAGFDAAGIASTPFAYALDISGEETLPLIEADPFRNRESASLLSDGEWISLQNICNTG